MARVRIKRFKMTKNSKKKNKTIRVKRKKK